MKKNNCLKISNDLFKLKSLRRSKESIQKIQETLPSILGYDFKISNHDIKWFSTDDKVKTLGQIETPQWAAELISTLCIKSGSNRILDPCFGDGIFLKAAYNRVRQISPEKIPNIFGVELDPIKFVNGLYLFLKNAENKISLEQNFFCGDIFDFKDTKFHAIVLNPPFMRQEELGLGGEEFLSKESIQRKISSLYPKKIIPKRSNLYIYFIVYLTHFLEDNGFLGAIIPKGWLDSKFGFEFQQFLLSNYYIEFIIDFAEDTFPNVKVEDCIIILRKSLPSVDYATKFVHIKKQSGIKTLNNIIKNKEIFENELLRLSIISQHELKADPKWSKFLNIPRTLMRDLKSERLAKLSNFADISRGLETNWNEFFIIDEKIISEYKIKKDHIRQIISSPRRITMMATNEGVKSDYLLSIKKDVRSILKDVGLRKYIKKSAILLQQSKTNTILRDILKNKHDSWFILKPAKPAPIIFSYIIRDAKNFFFNSGNYIARDNFYNIFPKKVNSLLLFTVLNSSLVKLNLELVGRRYGNGMLKIQTYELKDMQIPDISKMPNDIKDNLVKLGQDLCQCKVSDANKTSIIKKIDSIIDKFCKLGIKQSIIIEIENKLRNERLTRKRRK